MTLFQYLVDEKRYTEAEAEETVIRFENGMEVPQEVKQDINEYYNKHC